MASQQVWFNSGHKHLIFLVLYGFGLFALGTMFEYFTNRTNVHNPEETSYFSRQRRSIKFTCPLNAVNTSTGQTFYRLFTERNAEKFACVNSSKECMGFGLPNNYNAYHLNGKSISIDGIINEDAWAEVPWSELFVDIRSAAYEKPYYDTKFKLRWDDTSLYIAAILHDNDLWATKTTNDTELWRENSFSILISADASLFNYKQIDVNVLGTVTDLLIKKSYWDAPGQQVHDLTWDSKTKIMVFTPGTINKPGDRDEYWSVEISIPFDKLEEGTNRMQQNPTDYEVWFLQFARKQHSLLLTTNGEYEISPNNTGSWWAWQPTGAVNIHRQDRWGLVQFNKFITDREFVFQNWHIYKALFDVLQAMKSFKAKNGVYTNAVEELDISPYLFTRICVDLPEIRMRENRTEADFDIIVRSMLFNFPPSYIRSDKFVIIG